MLRRTYPLICLLLLSPAATGESRGEANGGLDDHARKIIDGILYSDGLQFNKEKSNKLVPFTGTDVESSTLIDESLFLSSSERRGDMYIDTLTTNSPGDSPLAPIRSAFGGDLEFASSDLVASSPDVSFSLDRLNNTFLQIFQNPRGKCSEQRVWKEKARDDILKHMQESSLLTKRHPFVGKSGGSQEEGMNLVGIMPGRYYGQKGKDSLIVVGAHYDTVCGQQEKAVTGIVDNASGVVAVLELARLLSSKPKFNHTIMFVAFDHEELGLLGSRAFVNEFLIPNFLKKDNVRFIAAYLIDMALTYDPSPESQWLAPDIKSACPVATAKISKDGNKGDFMAVWMRRDVDYPLFENVLSKWSGFPKYKLRALDPPLPASKPERWQLMTMATFTRSDHASFWYHHQDYPTLPAVLITDLEQSIGKRNSSGADAVPLPPPKELLPAPTERNNRGNGRGSGTRGFRGRGNASPADFFPQMPTWHRSFPSLNIPSWARL